VVPWGDFLQVGLLADHSSRAPVAEELYSNGPHLVSSTFEVGNSALNNESATGVSMTGQYESDLWSASVTGYYTLFTDFIYQEVTGELRDGLREVVYQARDASYTGLDVEVELQVASWENGSLSVRALLDWVRAKVDVTGNHNLPRIPPMRYGFGIETQWRGASASLDYQRVEPQDNVANFEAESNGYDDLSAYLGVEFALSDVSSGELFLRGKNLTNAEQRHHTSFIKEFAPAPGRTIEAGARLVF
jgi:iron complex outermembrane receptor protein